MKLHIRSQNGKFRNLQFGKRRQPKTIFCLYPRIHVSVCVCVWDESSGWFLGPQSFFYEYNILPVGTKEGPETEVGIEIGKEEGKGSPTGFLDTDTRHQSL